MAQHLLEARLLGHPRRERDRLERLQRQQRELLRAGGVESAGARRAPPRGSAAGGEAAAGEGAGGEAPGGDAARGARRAGRPAAQPAEVLEWIWKFETMPELSVWKKHPRHKNGRVRADQSAMDEIIRDCL